MEITPDITKALQRMFDELWSGVRRGRRPAFRGQEWDGGLYATEEFWVVYLNSMDCMMITREDLLENFDEMVNFGSTVKERLCLRDPSCPGDFLLLPMDLVERALVLGGVP